MNGIGIEFIRKLRVFRKDNRIQEIIRQTGKAFLKFEQRKCLHYYFYFLDSELACAICVSYLGTVASAVLHEWP